MDKDVPIRSISRSLAVLQTINRHGPMSLMEISCDVELPYPTTCRIIQTLVYEGLIEPEPTRKRYRATALVQSLSHGFSDHGSLVSIARPHLVELTAQFGWPFAVATHVGNTMMVRDSTHALSSWTLSNCYPGHTLPVLECASGHVYLANLPEEQRETMLAGLALTEPASLTLSMFESGKLVERIKSAGYATKDRNPHTANPGKTSSIAVPVFNGDQVIGALTVAFFHSAMTMNDAVGRYAERLKETGERVSQALTVATSPGRSPNTTKTPEKRRGGGIRTLCASTSSRQSIAAG